MAQHHKHIAMLSLAQCLFGLTSFAHGVYTGLAGKLLAPDPALATLPISVLILGTLISTYPLSLFMRSFGRRPGFRLAVLAGIGSGLFGFWAIAVQSFALFCFAAFLQGVYQAGGQYYRFAAMELAPDRDRARAVAYVLGGGVAAPILGPTLFAAANALFEPLTFAGAYIALVAIGLLAMLVLTVIPFPQHMTEQSHDGPPPRPLREIMREPVFICAAGTAAAAFAVMLLMMTGAPLAIIGCGFGLGTAATVIQWHSLGMFLPSFATGPLIARIGMIPVMLLGCLLFLGSGVIALSGLEVGHFKFSLLFVAVGWNFLYTAGTSMLADCYRPSEKAQVQAINECLLFGAAASTSLLAGVLVDRIGWSAVAIVALVASFALLLFILRFAVLQRKARAV